MAVSTFILRKATRLMDNPYYQQLMQVGVSGVIALFVWLYYRRTTTPCAERYMTFGPRFWAPFVDTCVLWPATLLTWGLFALHLPRLVAALVMVLGNLAWLFYTVIMHARYGQTVGKMVTKVKVVDARTEQKISWLQAWLREGVPAVLSFGFVVYETFVFLTTEGSAESIANGEGLASGPFLLLMSLPLLWFLAEVLTMLTNEKRRALHDFIAGTVVIRSNTREESVEPGAPAEAGDPSITPKSFT
jgi:uncharacterized RDD family membrane protein YckC